MASLIPHPQAEPISAHDCLSTLNAGWFWHDNVLNSWTMNLMFEFGPKKKEPFSQKNINLLADFGCFFLVDFGCFFFKSDFLPIFRFSAKRKNGCFSIIPARTRSDVNVDPNNFCWPRSKIQFAQNMNFWSFWAKHWPFWSIWCNVQPKKQYVWGAKVDFWWCGYQNFCSLSKIFKMFGSKTTIFATKYGFSGTYETAADVPESWVCCRTDFQSGSKVLKKVFWTFSISMAYNVISCQKVAKNTQILKIAKFAM